MELEVHDSRESAGAALGAKLATAVARKPDLVLGLSAGRTSFHAYGDLVARYARGGLTFRRVTTFACDEYLGLPPGDPRSSRYLLNYHLFNHIDLPKEQTYVPNGAAVDVEAECRAFDLLIEARGGVDVVVLGLGYNGHVALNEPGSSRTSPTRVVDLTPATLAAVSGGERFKNLDETPSKAITLGMARILEARKVLLIATGIGKAEIVHRMMRGRSGPAVPATLLMTHPDCTVIVDQDAVSRLNDSETRLKAL